MTGHTPPKYESADSGHYDALDSTGFFGAQAAGCVFLAKSTGRVLLLKRSVEVEQPHTWGNCGGAHYADEEPKLAAMREVREETGYNGPLQLAPMLVFRKGTFRYSNFLAVVEDEFVPSFGWEADEHVWCSLDDLPSPLHFGIEGLLADKRSLDLIKSFAKTVRD